MPKYFISQFCDLSFLVINTKIWHTLDTMIICIKKWHKNRIYRVLSAFIALSFLSSTIIPPQTGHTQATNTTLNLPVPGTLIKATDAFSPAILKGITVDPENPLKFTFTLDAGDSGLKGAALKKESTTLVKYFLASLTVPEKDMWVNLSPYEKDRIIPKNFGDTEMGRDLLAQDYLLKQLTASLMSPEDDLGEEFWSKVHEKAYAEYGVTDIPMDTFNKIWIIPEKAGVYEEGSNAFVYASHLKVMLEEDYVAMGHNVGAGPRARPVKGPPQRAAPTDSNITTSIIRDILLPEIEHEINEGKTFAKLRQIYHSMILATWYKIRMEQSLLGQVYVDKNKTKGIDTTDKHINQKIYDQYLTAFKKGVYNYIKEDYDPATQQIIPRKYFSGGFSAHQAVLDPTLTEPAMLNKGLKTLVWTTLTTVMILSSTFLTTIKESMANPHSIEVTLTETSPSNDREITQFTEQARIKEIIEEFSKTLLSKIDSISTNFDYLSHYKKFDYKTPNSKKFVTTSINGLDVSNSQLTGSNDFDYTAHSKELSFQDLIMPIIDDLKDADSELIRKVIAEKISKLPKDTPELPENVSELTKIIFKFPETKQPPISTHNFDTYLLKNKLYDIMSELNAFYPEEKKDYEIFKKNITQKLANQAFYQNTKNLLPKFSDILQNKLFWSKRYKSSKDDYYQQLKILLSELFEHPMIRKYSTDEPQNTFNLAINMLAVNMVPDGLIEMKHIMDNLESLLTQNNLSREEFAKAAIKTFTNVLEFSVDEFKDSMTPEALIEAIKIKNKIDIPEENTSIESLNNLLQRRDLYRFMKKIPIAAEGLVDKLDLGQELSPFKIKGLNRLILEENHPQKTPKTLPFQLQEILYNYETKITSFSLLYPFTRHSIFLVPLIFSLTYAFFHSRYARLKKARKTSLKELKERVAEIYLDNSKPLIKKYDPYYNLDGNTLPEIREYIEHNEIEKDVHTWMSQVIKERNFDIIMKLSIIIGKNLTKKLKKNILIVINEYIHHNELDKAAQLSKALGKPAYEFLISLRTHEIKRIPKIAKKVLSMSGLKEKYGVSDAAMLQIEEKTIDGNGVGGINLDRAMFAEEGFQILRNDKGLLLPVDNQPLFQFQESLTGFVPIIEIKPFTPPSFLLQAIPAQDPGDDGVTPEDADESAYNEKGAVGNVRILRSDFFNDAVNSAEDRGNKKRKNSELPS